MAIWLSARLPVGLLDPPTLVLWKKINAWGLPESLLDLYVRGLRV